MDKFFLGGAPCAEDCAQVGSQFFRQDESIETNAYIGQLKRMYGDKEIEFVAEQMDHDFGKYKEIVVKFNEESEEQYEHAIEIENNIPEFWDIVAIKEIIAGLISKNFKSSVVSDKYNWMKTEIMDVDQGRRLVRLIKKIRSGKPVSTIEIKAILA